MKKFFVPSLLLALAGFLAGCGSGDGNSNGISASTGSLNVNITDAPVPQAEEVVVTFTGLEVNGENDNRITVNFDTPRQINLLALQGVNSESLLSDKRLPAGKYNWIRLMVDESASYIQINGAQYPLTIPSGAQSGLKLNRNFTVGVGSVTSFTVDFDLHKSLHEASGNYILRPTLRIVNNLEVSAIRGNVDAALVTDAACVNNGSNNDIGNMVYLYSGTDVSPNDLTGNAGDAIVTAQVNYNADTGNYEYEIGYVPAGDYTLAFSCDGSIDAPDTDDAVVFSAQRNVTVVAAEDSNDINLP